MSLRIYKSKSMGSFLDDSGDVGLLEAGMADRAARLLAPTLRRFSERLGVLPGVDLRLRASVACWAQSEDGRYVRARSTAPPYGRTGVGVAWQNGAACFAMTKIRASTDEVVVETECAVLAPIVTEDALEEFWGVPVPLDGSEGGLDRALGQSRSLLLLGLMREINAGATPYEFLDPSHPLVGEGVLRDLLGLRRAPREVLDSIVDFYRARAIAFSCLPASGPHRAESLFSPKRAKRDPVLDALVARITRRKP